MEDLLVPCSGCSRYARPGQGCPYCGQFVDPIEGRSAAGVQVEARAITLYGAPPLVRTDVPMMAPAYGGPALRRHRTRNFVLLWVLLPIVLGTLLLLRRC